MHSLSLRRLSQPCAARRASQWSNACNRIVFRSREAESVGSGEGDPGCRHRSCEGWGHPKAAPLRTSGSLPTRATIVALAALATSGTSARGEGVARPAPALQAALHADQRVMAQSEITTKRIRRGVFRSVADLQEAIHDHLDRQDRRDHPRKRTASPRQSEALLQRMITLRCLARPGPF
jgi:hypothetical protein